MPMAGEGSRFLNEGWHIPKPLIKLRGIPLFKHAVNSVTLDNIIIKYSFIVRQEHIESYMIDKQIKELFPEANVFPVIKTTRGAVETCLIAEPAIEPDDSIIVMDCDLEFKSKEFVKLIRKILCKPVDEVNGGVLVSFHSNLPRYSYAEVNQNNLVVRTAEKKVISNHALCGAYFFSSAIGFLNASHKLINESNFKEPEYYVSLLYNYLLDNKETVYIANVDEYYSYGTPEELNTYL